MAGFYPVDHGDMDHTVFGGTRRFNRWEAYCWLLDHAAFDHQTTTVNGKPVKLDRGQIALSVGSLAKAWKWPKSSVQRFLEGLEREGFIVYLPAVVLSTDARTEARTDSKVITLCKYYAISTYMEDYGSGVRTDERTNAAITPYVLNLKKDNKGIRKNHHPSDGCQRDAENRQDSLFPSADVVTLKVDQEQAAFDAYNAMAERLDLRTCRSFSPDRRAKMRQRLREVGGIDGWMIALDKVSESHFIRSWRTGGWSAFGLHSLLQQETLARLMDDAYNGKRASKEPTETDNQRSVREYREKHGEDSLFHEILATGTRKP
jgi:hypothetical protein